jgi:NTP pyrophosphatase (non-canonical NTP hydrolase)
MERHAQDAKWGEQNHDDFIWTAILTEEVGEAAQAALHAKFGGHGDLREELVQVAAVALAWLECMDRRGS